jgi:molybdenum cofactor cytidylyltransferase
MKFGPTPVAESEGKTLGHNVAGTDGRRLLRKGKILTGSDIKLLRDLGRTRVYVAAPEIGDVDENAAALRVARAATGAGLRLTGAATGRVNILAEDTGVLRVDAGRLARLNGCAGITLATMLSETAVQARKMVATVKVLPFALPEATVVTAEQVAAEGGPIIRLDALPERRVALILSGSLSARERILKSFDPPLRARLEKLKAKISAVDFVPLEDTQGERELSQRIEQQVAAGTDLIILAGETAIMDAQDIAPRAVEQAGGEVSCFGAPVDPGNLLLLAYVRDVPVLGAPGCVRSPKRNIVDMVLPRLLVGDRLDAAEIYSWGHGGLLEDVQERPYPRGKVQD